MPGISEASCALKIGLVLSPLALVLTIVGMVTPYWLEDKENHSGHAGLWVSCSKSSSSSDEFVCMSYIDLEKIAETVQVDVYPGMCSTLYILYKGIPHAL